MSIKKSNEVPAVKPAVTREKLLQEIEAKAFELFEKRNGYHGEDMNDWLEAEKLVKRKYKMK